jgi:hypothetical protein
MVCYYKHGDTFGDDEDDKYSPIKNARYIHPLVHLLGEEFAGDFHEWWTVFEEDWKYIACFWCGNHNYSNIYFVSDNLIDLYKEIKEYYENIDD